MESLFRSCERSKDYPENLIRQKSLSHSLKAYSDRLRSQGESLFDEPQAAVDFWDLEKGDQGENFVQAQRHWDAEEGGTIDFHAARATTLDELKEVLREALRPTASDPHCRFMQV